MASAFTVSADGYRVDVGNVDFIVVVGGIAIRLRNIPPTIKRGQSVVVTYTDPNPGSDDATGVIQDLAGHDAASFTTGEDGVPAVVNDSGAAPVAPDAPTGLMAEAAGDTAIVLTWSPPAYNGGSAVTGYLIEVSPDGTDGSFTTREANHDVREDGGEDAAIVTAYTHTGLTRATTRHYRVKAINAAGTGAASAAPNSPAPPRRWSRPARRAGSPRRRTTPCRAPPPRRSTSPGPRRRRSRGLRRQPATASSGRPTAPRTGRSWSRTPAAGGRRLQRRRPPLGDDPPLPGLGDQRRRHGPPSNVDDATTEDISPPTGRRTPIVVVHGASINHSLQDRSLDITAANTPLPSAFTVTADGIPITIGEVGVFHEHNCVGHA